MDFTSWLGIMDKFVFSGQPLSTSTAPIVAVGLYVFLVFVGRKIMKQREAFSLKYFAAAHSFFLAGASVIVLGGILYELKKDLDLGGSWTDTLVDPDQRHAIGRLTFLYYVNYLLKYYELIDTGLLVLKKKPLLFLHVYHHAATLVLTYTQLVGQTGVQWVPITLNLFVHSVMYTYYGCAALKIKCPFKKYITGLQITQFVIDLFVLYGALITRYMHEFHECKWCLNCSGTYPTAIFGVSVISSYLVLFIGFYINSYNKPKKGKGGKQKGGKQVVYQNGTTKVNGKGRKKNKKNKKNKKVD